MNNFEAMYYDEYDYYNILPEAQFSGKSSRKGRTKAESQARKYVIVLVDFRSLLMLFHSSLRYAVN